MSIWELTRLHFRGTMEDQGHIGFFSTKAKAAEYARQHFPDDREEDLWGWMTNEIQLKG